MLKKVYLWDKTTGQLMISLVDVPSDTTDYEIVAFITRAAPPSVARQLNWRYIGIKDAKSASLPLLAQKAILPMKWQD